MRILSFIIILISAAMYVFPQSPHGPDLKIDCSNCHESASWKVIPAKIKFNHNTMTSFKLQGQHTSVSCGSCHKSLIFSDVKSTCISCHKDIHKNSVGANCSKCHTSSSWIVSNIIRIHREGRFPLVGVHLNVDCAGCHSGYTQLYFPPISTSCFSCHNKQYYAAAFPNHVEANFSTDCQNCHGVSDISWSSGKVNHSFFPLTGGHKIANCFACHKQGSNFKGLTAACYPCHKQNFVQAKNPDHIQANFPTTCQDCHNTVSFLQTTFNHNSTGFALTGAHANLSCQSCHSSGYTNTPKDCYSCHSQNFASTTDPNHTTQGFSHECSICHSTISWSGATFDHSKTGFPLTGAHASLTCQSCHASGYTNTSPACYSCHASNYNSTNNPPHASAGYPTDCTQCHTTTAWTPSTFNHTQYFPLTGSHNTACANCHQTISNFAIHSCNAVCHQNAHHQNEDCYTCHKTGGGDG